jgi:hypothetical protein
VGQTAQSDISKKPCDQSNGRGRVLLEFYVHAHRENRLNFPILVEDRENHPLLPIAVSFLENSPKHQKVLVVLDFLQPTHENEPRNDASVPLNHDKFKPACQCSLHRTLHALAVLLLSNRISLFHCSMKISKRL